MVQALVVEMTNLAIIDLCQPPNKLIAQAHDGVKAAVPNKDLNGLTRITTISRFKSSVEREWIIEGEKITSTASWAVYLPDGSHEKF